ncbi:MAG TPA: Fe-S cluster assembly protein SufD [Steroidobacteraceae bacterium]|nr:Fe-S cluster assembly protein SufD [Steroidobacteraceae bacterium]
MSSALATRISQEHASAASALPASVISLERRRNALQALETQGLPTSRDENWKYANLRPLEKVRFAPAAHAVPAEAARSMALPPPIAGYSRYTFVDGVFAPELSASADRPGIAVRSLRQSAVSAAPPSAPDARFALLNEAFATDGASVQVSAGADRESCLEIIFVASVDAQAGASYPRVELQVADGARFGLIERHLSAAGSASFVNGVVDISVGRGASVRHYRVQQLGSRALWFDTLSATLARDAKYRLYMISLGALSARSTVNIQLAGERADVGCYAASVADMHQSHDHFVLVDHLVPRAVTEQTFRGIAAGRARVGFNGKIVVRKDAHGTDSRQSLKGLLAGPEAEIDVRPQLEIYTDDVKCSHGATAGKLDDNMLFYLLSRGLDRDTAQRLLKWAFLEDVVARIEVPELRRQIEQSLAGQLNETVHLQELI